MPIRSIDSAGIMIGMVGVLFCGPWGRAAVAAPNVLIILADDMGYGDVQALNPSSKIPTPHLNRLAEQGMTFRDGHSPSAVCTPTRYGLLTGRYCWRTTLQSGVLGGYSRPLIEPDRPTIATVLQRAGYYTGAIGKWHLGMTLPLLDPQANVTPWEGDPGIDFGGQIPDAPIHHGFDEYFGVSASLDMAPYVFIRNDRFTALPTRQQPAVPFPHFVRKGPRAEDFVIDEVLDRLADEAVEFLRRAAERDQPFFLYLALTAPHKPTQPNARFRGTTRLGDYGDFVAQVDATIGRVLDALESQRLDDQTLVISTSDNGSYMFRFDDDRPDHVDDPSQQGFRADRHRANGRLRGTKADIWEAGHRVPLFVRWPRQVAAGSRCDETVCLTDVYATLAEIVGAQLGENEAEDSVSWLPMLRDQPGASRRVPVIHHSVNGMFAIREGRWKLVAGNGSGGREAPAGKPFVGPYQLFDLSADVEESRNVAAANPDLVERLSDRLEQLRRAGRPSGS